MLGGGRSAESLGKGLGRAPTLSQQVFNMLSLAGLHPFVRDRVESAIATAAQRGLQVRLTSVTRSSATQRRLYLAWLARGRTGLPAAPPGTSTHEFGLAVDLVMARGRLADFVRVAECAGLKWAGARDPVHFDVFGFEAWGDLLARRPMRRVVYAC